MYTSTLSKSGVGVSVIECDADPVIQLLGGPVGGDVQEQVEKPERAVEKSPKKTHKQCECSTCSGTGHTTRTCPELREPTVELSEEPVSEEQFSAVNECKLGWDGFQSDCHRPWAQLCGGQRGLGSERLRTVPEGSWAIDDYNDANRTPSMR